MGDTSSAGAFFKRLDEDRQEAVMEVQESSKALQKAKERYQKSVLRAHEVGVTNTSIAMAADRTEAAIRLFLKRKKMAR
jgi:hypothetical protein